MRIHICSSERDPSDIHRMASMFKEAGHTVWDWTQPEERIADIDETYLLHNPFVEPGPFAEPRYRRFRLLAQSCAASDLVIDPGGANFDTGRELGIAYALEIPVLSFDGSREEQRCYLDGDGLLGIIRMIKGITPPNNFADLKRGQNKEEQQ